MALLFVIIGGVVGGFLGWLFDRVTGYKARETTGDCETRT
jgi:hypothetical protein